MKEEGIEVPESEWTKGQREFVGSTFPTPKGGVLTVVGVGHKERSSSSVFIAECSICSGDTKLWPYGSIRSTKGNLSKGQTPCGCSSNVRWSKDQFKVKIVRRCEEVGYIFHNFSEEYVGNTTKLNLENPTTENKWSTTSINSFLSGSKDPSETRLLLGDSSRLSVEEHLQNFKIAGLGDFTFKRSEDTNSKGHKIYWEYTCPTCSFDEYVENGLCRGVFKASTSNLRSGCKFCRCSSAYKWTQGQRRYAIDKVLKEEGGDFIDWSSNLEYENSRSKFRWYCREGHTCVTTVDKFLNEGTRCPSCARYGYNPSEIGNLYLVEWFGFGRSYLKKGITNRDVLERVKDQHSKGKLDYHIIRKITGDGFVIKKFEEFLNKKYKGSACPRLWLPDGYTETLENTKGNYDNINKDFDYFLSVLTSI